MLKSFAYIYFHGWPILKTAAKIKGQNLEKYKSFCPRNLISLKYFSSTVTESNLFSNFYVIRKKHNFYSLNTRGGLKSASFWVVKSRKDSVCVIKILLNRVLRRAYRLESTRYLLELSPFSFSISQHCGRSNASIYNPSTTRVRCCGRLNCTLRYIQSMSNATYLKLVRAENNAKLLSSMDHSTKSIH